ncbi:hypothetical protein JCM33374_g4583 [Metschnikowia sp. JCM 33374]|nr:hypothetical protein JCM33374_g4583 [Metschnikowia sp. JCM 33374]
MPHSTPSLTDLPAAVLDNLLWFLPQHSLINLALTNFHFYEPCTKHLYRSIAIHVDPVLRNTQAFSDRKRLDHIESSVTTIGGFSSVATTRAAHSRLVLAKVHTLIKSIEINSHLASLITEISVHDDFGPEFALNTLVIDDLAFLSSQQFPRFVGLQQLIVAGVGSTTATIDASALGVLQNLRHLRIRDDVAVYDGFTGALWALYQKTPFFFTHLKTFNIVMTHENHSRMEFPYLNTLNLVNFQVSLACDDHSNCNQECLHEALAGTEFHSLKRLSIIQKGEARENTHRVTEKWDLIVFSFVKDILESCEALSYLSIRHNVPLDGIIDDGYEGNYLRKVKLYTIVLPRLLSTAQRHVVNLVLPNFVASLACYEQPMNTFLWNGCKCRHCAEFLDKLDEYMLYHRYYNPEKRVFKDIQTVQMVRTMSEVLCDRIVRDANLGDLHCLSGPMKNTTWNFHDNKFSIPFRCLPVKTYDIEDMEDDAVEAHEEKERFFDAEDKPNDCVFLRKERFFPNYSIVISHFLDDLIRKMINLNRGDAEDVDIGQINYENDGWTNLQMNKMLVNGIDYNFDHEINGTIFYTNSYDDAEFE